MNALYSAKPSCVQIRKNACAIETTLAVHARQDYIYVQVTEYTDA